MSRIWTSHFMDESCHTYNYTHSWLSACCRRRRAKSRSHIWMSHVKHMEKSWHAWECVMSQIRMSHITQTIAHALVSVRRSCRGVISRMWVSHITHRCTQDCTQPRPSARRYKGVVSHIRMSHFHAYGRVMSHAQISHVTHMDESCHTFDCTHTWPSARKSNDDAASVRRAVYAEVRVCEWVCACVQVCVNVYVCVCARVCVRARESRCTCVLVCVCLCLYIYVFVWLCVCVCVCICVYLCMMFCWLVSV